MHPNRNVSSFDVIIAGAGPVGLFLACELALAKCSVLVLESQGAAPSPLKALPFGIRGLSTPSIEALDRRGLFEGLEIYKTLKNPHKARNPEGKRQVGHFAGIPFHESDVDQSRWPNRLESSRGPILISEMKELEAIFTRRAEDLGVTIKRGTPLVHCRQDEDGVLAETEDQSYSGAWLVGCDGARSAVRKAGGFTFAGTEPEFTGYTVLADLDGGDSLGFGRHLTERGMYLQSQPGFLVIQDFDGGAFHDSKQELGLNRVQDVLRNVSDKDVTLRALHFATTWTDRARQATDYRKGRFFLAGDAAHIHSPLGGQGLNLGLGDAMNLGWKLAATIQGRAPAGLLESYQKERHPLGQKVLEWSRAQVALMRPNPGSRALNSVVRDLANTRDGASYFAERVWGLTQRYDLGDERPLIGCSAPNFRSGDGRTLAELLRGGRGLLWDFEGQLSWSALERDCGGYLDYVSAPVKESLGLKAVLVRPDGVVAWATAGASEETAVRRALSQWFA